MNDQWDAYWLSKAEEHFNNGKEELALLVLLLNHKFAKENSKWPIAQPAGQPKKINTQSR